MSADQPPLGGEAPRGLYQVTDANGGRAEIDEVVFPILRQGSKRQLALIGTGFFISNNGLFATAKHVLHDVLADSGRQTHAIAMIQFMPNDKYYVRPITRCVTHRAADVAIGVVQSMTHNKTNEPFANKYLTLSVTSPPTDSIVVTFAYPNTRIDFQGQKQELRFAPSFYEGRLIDHFPEGRDDIVIPWPCYHTSIMSHGGASGGPVIDMNSRAFAINSRGITGQDVSFPARVNEILPLRLDGVRLPTETTESTMSIQELAHAGFVVLDPPV